MGTTPHEDAAPDPGPRLGDCPFCGGTGHGFVFTVVDRPPRPCRHCRGTGWTNQPAPPHDDAINLPF